MRLYKNGQEPALSHGKTNILGRAPEYKFIAFAHPKAKDNSERFQIRSCTGRL